MYLSPMAVSCAHFFLLLKSRVNSSPSTARAWCPCWDLGCSVLLPSSKRLGCSLEAKGSGAACHGGLGHTGMDSSFPTVTQPSAVDFADLGQEALMCVWGCGA